MPEHRDLAGALGDLAHEDRVRGERRRVPAPGGDVRLLPAQRLLVEHAQLVVVGHQPAEPVDVAAIDAVDEVGRPRQSVETSCRHGPERTASIPLASVPMVDNW